LSFAPLVLVLGFSGRAAAEVESVAANGFEVATARSTSRSRLCREIGSWWSSAHTFSRGAANLSIELHADGCFCEQLKDGGSVQHLQVVYAAPGVGLRLREALGPLQMEGVDGTLSWALKPAEGGTDVVQSFIVGGYIRAGMEQWAPLIDRVLDEQLQRLKGNVEGKPPTQ
jgi:hypothetical protein